MCSRNVLLDPAPPLDSLRRAHSKRAHNAFVGISSMGPGPCVLPRMRLLRASMHSFLLESLLSDLYNRTWAMGPAFRSLRVAENRPYGRPDGS